MYAKSCTGHVIETNILHRVCIGHLLVLGRWRTQWSWRTGPLCTWGVKNWLFAVFRPQIRCCYRCSSDSLVAFGLKISWAKIHQTTILMFKDLGVQHKLIEHTHTHTVCVFGHLLDACGLHTLLHSANAHSWSHSQMLACFNIVACNISRYNFFTWICTAPPFNAVVPKRLSTKLLRSTEDTGFHLGSGSQCEVRTLVFLANNWCILVLWVRVYKIISPCVLTV